MRAPGGDTDGPQDDPTLRRSEPGEYSSDLWPSLSPDHLREFRMRARSRQACLQSATLNADRPTMEIDTARRVASEPEQTLESLTPPQTALSRAESREEWAIGSVAQLLAERIREAAETAFERRKAGEGKLRTYDVMPEVWPAGLQTHKSEAFLPAGRVPFEIAAQSIRFYPGDGGDSIAQCTRSAINGNYTGITVYLGQLDKADTREELAKVIARFEKAAWHESEHIFHMGADYDVDPDADQEARRLALVEYLSHPGEVRAHARQYALEFSREFPAEPFSIEKFMAIDGGKAATGLAGYYFRFFADPAVQARYDGRGDFAPLAETHRSIVALTSEMTLRFGMDRHSIEREWEERQQAAARLLYSEMDAFVESAEESTLGHHVRALLERADAKALGLEIGEIASFLRYVNQTPPSAGSFAAFFARHGSNLDTAP